VPSNLFLKAAVTFDVKTDGHGAAILEELIQYSRLFGCPPTGKGAGADYTVAGTITVTGAEPDTPEKGQPRYRWEVNATLRLLDTSTGESIEEFPLEGYRPSSASTEAAKALRAAITGGARQLARQIFYFGKTLGQPDVQYVVADLVIETREPYFYNDVVQNLKAMGPRVVPYLLWSMTDGRSVELKGSLPGISAEEENRVRVYDVANYALGEILGQESSLPIDASRTDVNRRLEYWKNEWTKRCAGYLVGPALKAFLAQHRARAAPNATEVPTARDARTDETGQSP
jgi:hypothetical protein